MARHTPKIVQIIPAADGTEINRFPAPSYEIIAWGLRSDGHIVALARSPENFGAELVPVVADAEEAHS